MRRRWVNKYQTWVSALLHKERRPFTVCTFKKTVSIYKCSPLKESHNFSLRNKTAHSTSTFIKCPLHVFRAHFNKTSTLISHIFLVQPVWPQDNEQKFAHFVHLQNHFPNFSYKTFNLIFWDIKCPQLFVNTMRIKQMSHKIRALADWDNDQNSSLLHRFPIKCVMPGYPLVNQVYLL